MELIQIIDEMNLQPSTSIRLRYREVTGVYASDLLSDVMANSNEGNIWITLQKHPNIIAVASMKELAGIILVNNRQPDVETIEKAIQENIPVLVSQKSTYELAGQLYQLMARE
jgi:hypothetical protein